MRTSLQHVHLFLWPKLIGLLTKFAKLSVPSLPSPPGDGGKEEEELEEEEEEGERGEGEGRSLSDRLSFDCSVAMDAVSVVVTRKSCTSSSECSGVCFEVRVCVVCVYIVCACVCVGLEIKSTENDQCAHLLFLGGLCIRICTYVRMYHIQLVSGARGVPAMKTELVVGPEQQLVSIKPLQCHAFLCLVGSSQVQKLTQVQCIIMYVVVIKSCDLSCDSSCDLSCIHHVICHVIHHVICHVFIM